MGELFTNLGIGFGVALSATNLLYCFFGVLLGTLIGVLPGIGPVATIAMLLPVTFTLSAGVRADHARRHLLRRAVRRLDHRDPGEPAGRSRPRWSPRSTATRWRARAAPARRSAIAAIGSFFAGCVGHDRASRCSRRRSPRSR